MIKELRDKIEKYEFIEKDVSELIVKTREDTTIAVNSEWSKRITSDKKKNEERMDMMEEKLKRKQNELDTMRVCVLRLLHIESTASPANAAEGERGDQSTIRSGPASNRRAI